MNDIKITKKEIELLDWVRRVFNREFFKDFYEEDAQKIYELIKILLNSKGVRK